MKTKEIREILTRMGYERGAAYILESQNEMLLQTRKDLTELATYFDKMVDSFNGVIAVAGRMKETIERFDKQTEQDGLGESTEGLDPTRKN